MRPRQKLGLISFVIISSLIIAVWFIFTPVSYAQSLAGAGEWLLELFSDLLFALAGLFIKLTFFSLKFIIEVAGYNGFIDSPAVIVGWVMVRDITNMFFVVVLLIISFGTILGLEQYEYKKLLVKLLMAAVIVNFSRLICGLIIDIAQVVMITFVNGIAATASGNLVNMFQVDQIFKLAEGQTTKVGSTFEIFLAAVAAIVFATMMLVTMLTFLFLLLARMAMLWVLIVLSPFAFVLNVLPQTEKYASQWWEQFGGHVVAGPIIAFFLWLSFVTVGAGTAFDEIKKHNALPQDQTTVSPEEEQTGVTQIMSWAKMANFAIAIAMLLAGAKMAEQLGVVGGGLMGKAGELGGKVARYASGLQAARWTAGNVLKPAAKLAGQGLYYGTNRIPGLAGIHPEAWKRRGRNIKSRVVGWYNEGKVKGTVQAGEISKAFKVNKKGEYVKGKEKVKKVDEKGDIMYEKDEHGNYKLDKQGNKIAMYEEARDKEGNILRDKDNNVIYKEQEILQSGAGDWFKRQFARARLEFGGGYDAFHQAYSEDLEATAEAKHEQLDHLASTSSLPVGLEKQKAKEWLEFLEHTGTDIKLGKAADMDKLREDIMHTIEHGGPDVNKNLAKLGLNDKEIFKAKEGFDRFNRSMQYKASTKVAKEYVGEEHKKQELKALQKYLGKAEGVTLESKTAELKAGTKQIEEKLQSQKELEELKEIKKLLEGKGEKVQAVILSTRAELLNSKEAVDIKNEEDSLRARARDYVKRGEEDKAEAYLRRADSLGLEKAREATKNLSGDEMAARAALLANRLVAARKVGNEDEINALVQKLAVLRSTAMTQPAWISPVVDREIERAIGITAAQKAGMTPQQYNLSLDLGKISGVKRVATDAGELESRLGGPAKNQAYLRDRRLAVESALEKSRREVAGTIEPDYDRDKGKVIYRVVTVADSKKSDAEYMAWSKKVDLTTSAGAPISNLGRDTSGKILKEALQTCATEVELMASKLAGLTANQFNRIPKVIEDLQKSDDEVKKAIVAMVQANDGHNKDFLKQLKSALNVED